MENLHKRSVKIMRISYHKNNKHLKISYMTVNKQKRSQKYLINLQLSPPGKKA
jgi:hypothetical protein